MKSNIFKNANRFAALNEDIVIKQERIPEPIINRTESNLFTKKEQLDAKLKVEVDVKVDAKVEAENVPILFPSLTSNVAQDKQVLSYRKLLTTDEVVNQPQILQIAPKKAKQKKRKTKRLRMVSHKIDDIVQVQLDEMHRFCDRWGFIYWGDDYYIDTYQWYADPYLHSCMVTVDADGNKCVYAFDEEEDEDDEYEQSKEEDAIIN